jgi:soluble lytic murein transglycosylase
MRFMTRELPMSRLAMYAASLATIGFIGGAVVGSHPGPEEESRAHRVAGQSEPIRQTEENAVSQEAELQRMDPLAAESAPAEAGVTSAGATGPQAAPPKAVTGLGLALELYRKGDMTGGDRAKSELPDPLDRELSEWAAVHFGLVSFDRIAAFTREHPDWPVMAALRRRAEEALLAARKPAAAVRAFFAERPPTGAEGKVALALALKTDGTDEEARALVRDAWRSHIFGSELEAKVLDLFPGVLTPVDHRERMERFLLKESWASALRAAAYAGNDYVLLAKARIAVAQQTANVQEALGAVPASLRSERSYLLARVQFQRRQEKLDEVRQVLATVTPLQSADGDHWWLERRLVARKLLDQGDVYAAYAIVRDNAAESLEKRIEAEFHAGWIALRFLNHPATAAQHFADAARLASKPISLAKTLYWQGRAAEALGAHEEGRGFLERAANHSTTYYGQLARAKLGLPEVQLRSVGNDGRAAFGASPVGKAVKRLYEAGYRDIAFALCADLAASLTDVGQLDALSHLVAEYVDGRTLLTIGKTAVQRGYPLDSHAFPLLGLPAAEANGGPVEEAMVYAVSRQESAFAPNVQSSAGARGLMQLMPDTARRTAKRLGLEFDLGRLLEPAYNTKLGAAHLGELMEDWKGSPILMLASYNAGGGNVSKWVRAYGDPRSPSVDPIDWVERIPFSETRNYVQRVIEGMLVYRHRLGSSNASTRPKETAQPRQGPVQ